MEEAGKVQNVKDPNSEGFRKCERKKACTRGFKHGGRCAIDKTTNQFWKSSSILKNCQRKKLEAEVQILSGEKQEKENSIKTITDEILVKEYEVSNIKGIKTQLEEDIAHLNTEYEKINTVLERRKYTRKKETTCEIIYNNADSTHYRRRKETANILKYIHGGEEGAIYGAWDYLKSFAGDARLEELLMNHKRGKFFSNLYCKLNVDDKAAMTQAVATKYHTLQTRRKYNMMCKIQNSTFDPQNGEFGKVRVNYGKYNMDLKTKSISHSSLEKFVKSIDIGQLHQIEHYSGVTRTVTALITMVSDLHLKVPSLNEQLLWFKGNKNHFVVEFSDDGAPENSKRTMTIGTLSFWNFGKRICSREFQYCLHTISAGEKDKVCELLWQQHCEEMRLIEDSVIQINGIDCTFQFLPSADTLWLCFAANVLGCSARYPSPFANVKKTELTEIGFSIGLTERWQAPTKESWEQELIKLNNFRSNLNVDNPERRHKLELDFMAEKGIRQLGPPRIGDYANLIAPEPMHLEINNWQHILNLIYWEAIRRGRFDRFLSVLAKPPIRVEQGDVAGCGLSFVANQIKAHFENQKTNDLKRLDFRLIGSQAISLAQYSYRLVDALMIPNETKQQILMRNALSKICQTLRDIGSYINRIVVCDTNYSQSVHQLCTHYFNLVSLFFTEECQITVWTMGHVIPYHVKRVYNDFGVGYGIMSMQGKEAKHSILKQDLRYRTNQSTAKDGSGKWHQVARMEFIRKIYLPYHFPAPQSYHSHYRERKAPSEGDCLRCHCSREIIDIDNDCCQKCLTDISKLVSNCVEAGKLTCVAQDILKPHKCNKCDQQYADNHALKKHQETVHVKLILSTPLSVKTMSKTELKLQLERRHISTAGTVKQMRTRLEGYLMQNEL